jgi:ABC-type polysaccharide/polyol phosphate export permease
VSVRTGLAELASSRELLINLTLRELRGKYKRTALGWGWSLLNPLSMMLVFTLVFGVLFNIDTPVGDGGLRNYALFLMCGLLPWLFLSNAMTAGMGSLTANANLLKKTWFRREVLVVATVLSFSVSFLVEMSVLVVALLLFGVNLLPYLPLALGLILLLMAFVTGLSLGLSVLNVYYRDAAHFIGIFLQIWFYSTPILYPLTLVTDRAGQGGLIDRYSLDLLYQVNPMVGFVSVMRDLLYVAQLPSPGPVAYVTAVSLLTLVGGYALFRRLEGRLAEEL